MIQIKERPEEKIETKELKKIAAIYKEMNPTNRYLIMSASGDASRQPEGSRRRR